MKLQELQELFTNDVTISEGPHSEFLLQNVRNTKGVNAQNRLDVYRSNIVGLHLNVLDDIFPVVGNVLGQRYWHYLLGEGIKYYCSPSFDLNRYGEFVPRLLEEACSGRKELAEFAYLSNLAQLELAVHRLQFCKNDPAFDWNAFQKLSPQQQSSARLVTSASLALFISAYPVDALWYGHQEGLPQRDFDEMGDEVICCIYRDDQFKVTLERLSGVRAQLLERLVSGTCLDELQAGDICEPDELTDMLFSLIDRGWIIGFDEVG